MNMDASPSGDRAFVPTGSSHSVSPVPASIPSADELLDGLMGVMRILSRAESNASGNPEWDYVGPRVAKVRELLARAGVAS